MFRRHLHTLEQIGIGLNGTITDIPGIRVGHVTRTQTGTGCTVLLMPPATRASVVVRGGGPGARELQLLDPVRSVPFVDAILLTGGSAFGLSAADGVVKWLDERGIGHSTPWASVPIVPAAVIFDLAVGSSSDRPTAADGYLACERAHAGPVECGSVGAGTGATVGKWGGLEHAMKGGLGSASIDLGNGIVVGALAVVNAIGDVMDRESGRILAGSRSTAGSGFRAEDSSHTVYTLPAGGASSVENTTLCVVATNASFTKTELKALASTAHNGLARAVKPVNTPHDGDLVFAVSCGDLQAELFTIGAAAADAIQSAVEAALRQAVSLFEIPALGG